MPQPVRGYAHPEHTDELYRLTFDSCRTTYPADLTVSKRPGTSYQIEIHFAVVNHLYLLFAFVKLVETL